MNPGARIVLSIFDAELTRGTDGVVVYDTVDDKVAFVRVHELSDETLRETVEDALTDFPTDALVVEASRRERVVWRIPKQMVACMVHSSGVLRDDLPDLPLWSTLCQSGRSHATLPP